MTRQEYLKNPGQNHRKYYGQFVTQELKNIVAQKIHMSRITKSTDPHMNDIPLVLWDTLANQLGWALKNQLKAKECGYSLAVGVCVLKEAARQLKEEAAEA